MDIRYHGGACCGVRHIFGMDNSTEADLVRLITELDNEAGQGNRLIEIILSQRQVGASTHMQDRNPRGGWPAILQRHGFRLVSRFNNSNSRNDCYIFHRVPTWRSIAPEALPFEWDHAGYTPPPEPAVAPAAEDHPAFRRGDRVRYNPNSTSRRAGQTGRITAPGQLLRIRWDNDGEDIGGYNPNNIINLDRPQQPVAIPPMAAPAVVVARLWQNVFADGRRGGMYPAFAGAREAAPRCRRIDRVEIFSDGMQRVVENVTE